MTSTVERPALPRPRPRPAVRRQVPERSPLAPGLVAAGWAAGAGLVTLGVPVLLVWATDSRSGSGAAAATRSVGQLWLLAHGAALTVPGGPVGLTPLGLALLPLALLHRAGRHAARSAGVTSLAQALRLVVAVAFPYAVLGGVLAAAARTAQVRPAPVQAVLGALAVAAVGASSGVLREAGLLRSLRRLPPVVRRQLVGTLGATAALLAAGSLLSGLAFVLHAGRATSLASASDPGVLGGVALFAAGLACVPNAAVWGAAWLAGPGFAVGVGTTVGPFGTTLGAVPALPLLAALPSGPVPVWLGVVALAVPVGAGAVGGVLLGRRLACGPGRAALEGLLLGALSGLVLAAAAWQSGGPLGGGRLTDVGPSPWRVGLAVALEVGAGAAASVALVRRQSAGVR
jgi:hypothetical protein